MYITTYGIVFYKLPINYPSSKLLSIDSPSTFDSNVFSRFKTMLLKGRDSIICFIITTLQHQCEVLLLH